MTTSQNGWTVISSDDLGQVQVNGVALVPGVRRSLVPLVADFCERLAKIEAPHPGWCWGWAFRPIRGQTSGYSNHASGTAWDWNAPAHGRGGRRFEGFAGSQVGLIHRLLERYDGVIRWGGDYRTPPFDPMHFEVVGSADQVRRVIDRLKGREEEGLMAEDVKQIREDIEAVKTKVEATFNHISKRSGEVFNETHAVRAEVAELRKLFEGFLLKQGGSENPTGRIP